MRPIFAYLKRKKLTDTQIVNKLFSSAYLRHHGLVPQENRLLVDVYISEDSSDDLLLKELTYQLEKNDFQYTLEDLTKLFEFVISPEDRKVTGAVYTPAYIRERVFEETLANYDDNLDSIRIADISCGCGGFFLTAAKFLHTRTGKSFENIIQENIYGIDIQSYSIERTKLLLSLLALTEGEDVSLQFNLWQADALCFDFTQIGRLDIIVGNPPYVCARNMNNASRELMRLWKVCSSGNSDLYIPFFQIATEIIREGGRVGYITMNSFLTSLNGRSLREFFYEQSYRISIVDFRGTQMFSGKYTYTCLFFMEKTKSDIISYCTNESKELAPLFTFSPFQYSQLDNKRGWKLNDFKHSNSYEKIGTPLGQFCQSRHGIATLSNKTYVFTPISITEYYYTFVKNGQEFKVEKAICRKIINSNRLNSGVSVTDILEYIIFPYIQNEHGVMEIIPESTMMSTYPNAYRYLQSCKAILSKRDKGKTGAYPAWYAYGRTQSLRMPRYKLFFPKIANKVLHCKVVDDKELLLYNGMAFVSDDKEVVTILKTILESDVFWEYVKLNSKPYASGYYSLNGVNIKNFGIPPFTKGEKEQLLRLTCKKEINNWLLDYYHAIHLE